jgi:hypothetical protein
VLIVGELLILPTIECMRIQQIFFILLCLLANLRLGAQDSWVRQAQSKMQDGKWSPAKELLTRAIQKDSTHVEAKLTLAQWFFATANPLAQIDSAYRLICMAQSAFNRATLKQRERLAKDKIDDGLLVKFRSQVDSAAFERAKKTNSEDSYNYFLSNYPLASQKLAVIELRDEVSYLDALKKNTSQAYAEYFQRYPSSLRAEEAQKKYHTLLYQEKTRDRKLESYESFIRDFPSSPYLKEANRQIFEISTADGSIEAFSNYFQQGGDYENKKIARNIALHLLLSQEQPIPRWFLNDSVQHVLQANRGFWIPFLQDNRYGFLDSLGREVVAPQFTTIDEDIRCSSIYNDVISTSAGLLNRTGRLISSFYPYTKDIGSGFWLVGDSLCRKVIHKSGQVIIAGCLQDAQVTGSFLTVKAKGGWAIYTLTGRQLVPPSFDSVEYLEGVYALTRLEKKTLVTASELASIANGQPLKQERVFDEVKMLTKDRFLVRMGALEGILNNQLEFVVPLARQSMTLTNYGVVRKVNEKYSISGVASNLNNQQWDKITQYQKWLVLQATGQQKVYDLSAKSIRTTSADSIWFKGGLLFLRERDSVRVFSSASQSLALPLDHRIHFIPSKDSVSYFFTEGKGKKTVYDLAHGKKLFVLDFSKIESVGKNLFLINRKTKAGLVNLEGKLILPVEYDAVVQTAASSFSLWKHKKFGLFDASTNKILKPQFDRNVLVIDQQRCIAYKAGRYAVIDWQAKPLTPFEFEEVQVVNEKLVWTKKVNQWALLDLTTNQKRIDQIDHFRIIGHLQDEIVFLVSKNKEEGVYSTKNGLVVPIRFSYVANVGKEDFPIYLTDKEVREANVHVVIYYDHSGRFLRKQVYEEAEFERLICEDN